MRPSILASVLIVLALALPLLADKTAKEPVLLEKAGKPAKQRQVFLLSDTMSTTKLKDFRVLADTTLIQKIKASEEFRKYWAEVEARSDLGDQKKQLDARDIDKSWVPKLYLFDSTVVVWPVWMLLRGKK